ncbi:receptor homology region, transmembrane domain- and RING domain-containing protein 2-like [Andrographis paniculata]|uniref:receptor homology region, transmembrane domain- and RING domain-containing protein 2-like n=1 Tax=Andrographis paniculata TaxID=175694 RepID=UPI0021E6EF60|nr:receptor homology region, transmembrane domain- and RING domain-containing protein 2-like [Andrographis paniculata]
MWILWVFLFWFYCLKGDFTALGNVVLMARNTTLSFEAIEATFAPSIKPAGIHGILYVAKPLNACSPLTNTVVPRLNDSRSPFALIIRGGCSFENKIRQAQSAGFEAAIVYDNEYGDLVAMAGNSPGIKISALFVSKTSGETLAKYAGADDMAVWIYPSSENTAWSIMAISFISLLAMSAVLATCFFVRRHRIRRDQPQAPRVREFHGMGSRLVKAMPSLIFTKVLDERCTSTTCAICLEDYIIGDKLRMLPCCHRFHAVCVDAWLTTWRTFCPVCKRDARTSNGEPPASESTPLLSSNPSSVTSSSILASFRSSPSTSSAMQIGPPHSGHSQHSLHYPQPASRSSLSLLNGSSQMSHFVSPHSLGYPSLSPLNSRYLSPYIPSPSNASSGYLGSSSRQANALHYSESAASLRTAHGMLHYSESAASLRHVNGMHYSESAASLRQANMLHNSESAASFSPYASGHSLPGC